MNHNLRLLAIVLTVLGYGTSAASSEVEWETVFVEEFDGDLEDWDLWHGGAFNRELQLYSPQRLSVESGILRIESRRENVEGPTSPYDQTMKAFAFSSGRMHSKRVFGPKKGGMIRFSARIKLPHGHGLWPSWWSYRNPWPTLGEIDVMEARGDTLDRYQTNFHFGKNPGELDTNPLENHYELVAGQNLGANFHIYAVEWSEDRLAMLFDGQIVKEYDATHFPHVRDFAHAQHHLVLNLAVGGTFFSELHPERIPDQAKMRVDWVRVERLGAPSH